MTGDESTLKTLLLIDHARIWGAFAPVGSELVYELAANARCSALSQIDHQRAAEPLRGVDVAAHAHVDAVLLIEDSYRCSADTAAAVAASHPGIPLAALQLVDPRAACFDLGVPTEQVVVDAKLLRNGNRRFVDRRVVEALESLLRQLDASCTVRATLAGGRTPDHLRL